MAEREDPEWLLWCKRLKLEHGKFEHQISTLTQDGPRIESLVTNLTDLTSSKIKHFHTECKTFKNRIAGLEKDLRQQNRSNPDSSPLLNELREENDKLEDRVLKLEQDAERQDQLNNVSSQAKATLEQQHKILKMEFNSVTNAVGIMQKTMRLERQGMKNELEEMKAQVEALVDGASQRDSGSAHEVSEDIAGGFPASDLPLLPKEGSAC